MGCQKQGITRTAETRVRRGHGDRDGFDRRYLGLDDSCTCTRFFPLKSEPAGIGIVVILICRNALRTNFWIENTLAKAPAGRGSARSGWGRSSAFPWVPGEVYRTLHA